MINLFPPGGIADPDLAIRDPMKFDAVHELHERKMREYFDDTEVPDSDELLFVAFAEIYFSSDHLDDVALYHDFIEWQDMRDIILSGGYPVPNIKTVSGIIAARKLLQDPDFV